MNNKLFVGGLSWGIKDDQLHEAFKRFGLIREAKVITDRHTGRSKGFGFVSYESSNDAQEAVDEMNGVELEGRAINVSIAKDR